MKSALAIVTALLAAGCLSATPDDLEAASAPLLPEGLEEMGDGFHTGFAATEPSLGVAPDGGVYMTAMKARPGSGRMPTIVRSLDGGHTWDDVGPITHLNTNDPIVHVDPDTGRVFTSDILPLSCTFLSWSDDQGASWTTNPYACGNSQVNDHQTIVTARSRALPTVGYPKIVYICTNNVAYSACATSLDGGLTFGPQIPVDHGVDASQELPLCGAIAGHLRAGPDGKVYWPKSECSIQPSRPVVYVTEDDGVTWAKKVIADVIMDPHEVGFAVDEENNLYATWPTPDGLQQFAYSRDGGDTWSEPRNISAPGVTATAFTVAVAKGVGKVAFAYIGSTIEGGYEGKGTGNGGLAGDVLGQPDLPEWDNATWNAYIGVIEDVFGEGLILHTTANPIEDPLARGLCGRTRCHGMNDFIEGAVGPDGRPWFAFVDVCTEACVSDPTVHADSAVGFAATLVRGPALLTGVAALDPLAP